MQVGSTQTPTGCEKGPQAWTCPQTLKPCAPPVVGPAFATETPVVVLPPSGRWRPVAVASAHLAHHAAVQPLHGHAVFGDAWKKQKLFARTAKAAAGGQSGSPEPVAGRSEELARPLAAAHSQRHYDRYLQ